MNIDQYHRRETMQPAGSGSVTLAPNISTQGEIGRLGNVLTDIGFGLESMRLEAQYEAQKNKAILEAKKGYLDFYENLDPNDTDSWEARLEEYQKTLDNIKVTNGRAMRELPTIFEDMKLDQRKSIISYRNSVDMRNFQRDYRANYETSMILAAKAPSRPQFEGEVIDAMQNIFGLEKIDPDKPITEENIRRMEGYENPLFLSEKTRKSEFDVWLNDAELAYESEQRDRTLDQFKQQAEENPYLFLSVMEDLKREDLPENMRDDPEAWGKLKTLEKAVRADTAKVSEAAMAKWTLGLYEAKSAQEALAMEEQIKNIPGLTGEEINKLHGWVESRVEHMTTIDNNYITDDSLKRELEDRALDVDTSKEDYWKFIAEVNGYIRKKGSPGLSDDDASLILETARKEFETSQIDQIRLAKTEADTLVRSRMSPETAAGIAVLKGAKLTDEYLRQVADEYERLGELDKRLRNDTVRRIDDWFALETTRKLPPDKVFAGAKAIVESARAVRDRSTVDQLLDFLKYGLTPEQRQAMQNVSSPEEARLWRTLPKISSDAEYEALPPGPFIDPKGKIREKK